MACADAVRRRTTLCIAILSVLRLANAQIYYFSGAVQVTGSGSTCDTCSGSGAVQAQCPADHPTSCDSIGATGYCCPSGNTCSWSNAQVACCPSGCTCTGWEATGGYNSYIQPTSTYYPPATTYYTQPQATTAAAGGVIVVTKQAATTPVYEEQTTTQVYYGGQYCSTLVAKGPNLPTTAMGQCGVILVVPSEAMRVVMGWLRLGAVVVGMQVLDVVVFARR